MGDNVNPRFTRVIGNAVYEIIPTEKGYSYIIAVALSISMIFLYGHMTSLGMMFNDFLSDIGGGVSELTFLFGLANTCLSFSGIFTNVAMKKFTLRQVGLLGTFLYISSWYITVFSTNVNYLAVSFIMMGIGSGIVFSISFTAYNIYFVTKKSIVVMSICQLIICAFTITIPLLIDILMQNYGYRGMLLIYTALMMHLIFAVIALHPLEWHSKKRLLYHIVKDEEETVSSERDEKVQIKSKFTVKKVKEGDDDDKSSGKLTCVISELLDMSLLKDLVFLNIMIGGVSGMMSDVAFTTIFPKYLYDFGLETAQVASILSIMSTSDLIGRAFLVIFTKFYKPKSEFVFYIGVIFSTFVRLGLLFCDSITHLYVISAFVGFFRALTNTPYVLVFSEYVPEKFTAAIGWAMLIFGLISLPILSFIGFLYTKFENCYYSIMFIFSINFLCIIPWTIRFWYFRRKNVR